MVRRYNADLDAAPALINKHLREICAEMASELLTRSDLIASDEPIITFSTRRVRNRAKTITSVEYVITASLTI